MKLENFMKAEKYHFDLVVIGAGIIGIAVSLAHAKKGLKVLLIERNPSFGQGISSRNSEVIHAGLYYPPNSLKAKFCRSGRDLLYRYCKDKMIPHKKIGKLIVQTDPNQQDKLQEIYNNGLVNGCSELCLIDKKELQKLEPEITGINAIWSPMTGIVDSHAFMNAMLADLQQEDTIVVFNQQIERVYPTDIGMECLIKNSTIITTKKLVNSTGSAS